MKIFRLLYILILVSISNIASAQYYKTYTSSEIQSGIEKLKTTGSVLYIAAHPDDENTRLLAYLSGERKLRTAYLSLTRGDGGQNLIGTEQAELLGLIRTQELLAARRIDGAEQFFTRANDFGFSKNPEETFSIWNKDSVLADVVWVIRTFKPDLIITRFPTDGSGGHGHHTASAILAEEAFAAAADPDRFPEQLKYTQVWKAKRLVWNGFNFGGRPQSDGKDFIKLDIGAYNPLFGKSYGEIASLSRSQHKSQGFGVPMQRGISTETFRYVAGDTIKTTIFDGINFSWNRMRNGERAEKLINKIAAGYNPKDPAASIGLLTELYSQLETLDNNYWKTQKQKEVLELIMACAGLFFETTSSDYTISPGDQLKLTFTAINRSSQPVQLKEIRIAGFDTLLNKKLEYNTLFNQAASISLPGKTPYTNPYWLIDAHTQGLFKVSSQELIGKPEAASPLTVTYTFLIAHKEFKIQKAVSYKWTNPVKGELYRTTEVVPPVSISSSEKNLMFTNASAKKIAFTVKAHTAGFKGTLTFDLPKGWKINPEKTEVNLSAKNDEQNFSFEITPSSASAEANGFVIPHIEREGESYTSTLRRIEYDHIPVQTLIAPLRLKATQTDAQKRGQLAGYIPGAGDDIPSALKQLGFEVVNLTDELLEKEDLKKFDVIVCGIRAYNTNDRLTYHYTKLMSYVENGGNLVVQYNTNNFISTVASNIGPYPFQVSRDRVTDEHAEMRILRPDHRLLNYPNKIKPGDFEGWIQERGLYFVQDIDANYQTLFSCNDAGEKANEGILITTQYGKGYFTYTGISFFRQLPAGVPGAYRLFANIVSQGK